MRIGPSIAAFPFACAALLFATSAFADKLVVLPPTVTQPGNEAMSEPVRAALGDAAQQLGFTEASGSESITAEVVTRGRPDSHDVLQQAATITTSDWALSSRITPHDGGYRIEIQACQASSSRVESLARDIESNQAPAQLREMLALLLRPEGIANADIPWEHALVAPPPPLQPPPAETPAPPSPAPVSPPPPKEPPPPSTPKRPYDDGTPYAIGAGLGFLTAAGRPHQAIGTATSSIFDLGFGYAPSALPGLETGGRIGWSLGGPASFALDGTARYMFPVVAAPRIYVGPEVGLGLFATLGAKQQAYLDLRAAAVGAWTIVPNFSVEASLSMEGAIGELFLLGGTVRAVVHF